MRRMLVTIGVVVGLVTLISAAPTPPLRSLPQKLSQRVNFPGIDDDGRAVLNDALEKLSKLYDVTFDINEQAFKMDGLQDVGKTEIAQPTPIPEMKNVRLSEVLRQILRRVPAPSGVTYTIRDDHLEITTGTFQRVEIWGRYGGPFLTLVNATLDKCPLEEAVRQLAEQAEFTVLVDGRAAEKTKTTVSARLLNTPLDTALRLLADMADLRTIQLDNVFYITTKEKAAALEKQLEKEKNEKGSLDDNTPEGLNGGGWRRGSGRILTPLGGGG